MSTPQLSAIHTLLLEFSPCFSAPSFENFVVLVTGWILCTGRHTISRVLSASPEERTKHHSAYYRFFSRAVWACDPIGQKIFELALRHIPDQVVHATVDDTLCRKSGSHMWGGGMHHDPLLSNYGRRSSSVRKSVSVVFGHNWVVMSVWVPRPWSENRRGWAIPVLLRFYRAKKGCPADQYRKRTELAAEMSVVLMSWLPEDRRLRLLGDSEYACKTVVRPLPKEVEFIGPVLQNAALFAPLKTQKEKRRGRPRKKGKRLQSPKELANDNSSRWKTIVAQLYGRRVRIKIKTRIVLWYTVAGTRRVKLVVTRDPTGRIEDRAYLSTNTSLSARAILEAFSLRWWAEVMHRDAKQHLGLEDPQNGWWRRPRRGRPRRRRAGPQPHPTRGENAVRHTVPVAFLAYAVVVLWYIERNKIKADLAAARRYAPWYADRKKEPSFLDMLVACRRELWAARLSRHPRFRGLSRKMLRWILPSSLLAA